MAAPCLPKEAAGRPALSIIIPVLNEAATIETLLLALQPMRIRGCELLLVDGGSTDKTMALALPLVDKLLQSAPGRAVQMNAGAGAASAALLWFLHADSQVPAQSDRAIQQALSTPGIVWGYFQIRLSGRSLLLRVIEWAMNQRVRCTHVATGDHSLFISREMFESIGGYPHIALMEDIAISKRLRILCRPLRIEQRIVTSSRRWESRGVVRTVLHMWYLRSLYFIGVSPAYLARLYRPDAAQSPYD